MAPPSLAPPSHQPADPSFLGRSPEHRFSFSKGAELQISSCDLKCLETTSEQPLRREATLKRSLFLAFLAALAFMFLRWD